MSPPFLFLDLLILVLGFPIAWTVRDLAPRRLAATGVASFWHVAPAGEPRLMRAILLGWHRLGPGDVVTIDTVLATPASQVATVTGSPGHNFWNSLTQLGWAERKPVPPALARCGVASEMFALTGEGVRRFPDFRRRYDLVFGTSYAAKPAAWAGGSLADRFQ